MTDDDYAGRGGPTPGRCHHNYGKGCNRLALGDIVSIRIWPKGRGRGVLEQSPTFKCGACGGPAFRVVIDGRAYGPILGGPGVVLIKTGGHN